VRRVGSIALLLLVGCGGAVAPAQRAVRSRRCEEVAFRAPPAPPRRAAELVIAVNDVVCRREPLVPGRPGPRGRVIDWCPSEIEPGGNRVEIAIVEGCGRARARTRFACAGPEPD
jgi:hypothetical protein